MWHTAEAKDNELESLLNLFQGRGYTIFSIMKMSRGGFSEYFMIVYYE